MGEVMWRTEGREESIGEEGWKKEVEKGGKN